MIFNKKFKNILNSLALLMILIFIASPFPTHASNESEEEIAGLLKSSVRIEEVSEEEKSDEEEIGALLSSGSQQNRMAFKLGFEFQEINGLCPWALNDSKIQKKAIFLVKDTDTSKDLWEVVIDGNDIEFVTKPFSYREEQLLEKAINTILIALNFLKEEVNSKENTTFELWTKNLTAIMPCLIEYPEPEIYKIINTKGLKPEKLPWTPHFAPQATIQHHLEHTIPLYFSLFGFSSHYMPSFSASLPLRDDFLEAQQEADSLAFGNTIFQLKTKINGLVFLHALTMTQMAPSGDETDSQLLKETDESFEYCQQIDPKMKLTIMSRRPFSLMFRDIQHNGQYSDHFKEVMKKNSAFFKVPNLFGRVNYAEQYFDPVTGLPRDLTPFNDLIKEAFFNENLERISSLLKSGIISTTMIRNFKDNITVNNIPISMFLQYYYNLSLQSVDTPSGSITIDFENKGIKLTEWDYDLLSPPVFLDKENSMGRFREDMHLEDIREYGEAIVEVRGIKDVQSWFLKKCDLDPGLSGKFLVDPNTIREYSLKLFNYLKDFGSDTFDYEIITLGFSHALRKYS